MVNVLYLYRAFLVIVDHSKHFTLKVLHSLTNTHNHTIVAVTGAAPWAIWGSMSCSRTCKLQHLGFNQELSNHRWRLYHMNHSRKIWDYLRLFYSGSVFNWLAQSSLPQTFSSSFFTMTVQDACFIAGEAPNHLSITCSNFSLIKNKNPTSEVFLFQQQSSIMWGVFIIVVWQLKVS